MRILSPILLTLMTVGTAHSGDWPQWLGPNRDGSTDEKIAPWKQAPQAAWRVKVGEGHSSPVIAGGRVFLHTKVADKAQEQVTAYDLSGTKLWSKTYDRGNFSSIFGNGPRSTPLVDGERLYTFGVTGILTCWQVKDGKQIWQVDTAKDFKPPALRFGTACSPIVIDDNVLINVGAKGASIVAFNKKTGKVAWKSQDDPPSYSSPIVFTQNKTKQVVFLTAEGVVSLNPKDGSFYWRVPLKDIFNESSTTPVRVGDRILASSVTFGSLGIEMSSANGKPSAKQIWRQRMLSCYFSTPTAVGREHIYLVTGRLFPSARADLRCVELKTGKQLWKRKQAVGKYHAALLRTGDDHLLMLEEDGQLVLFKPDPKGYRELARAKVCGSTWAHPALSNGKVYLRDNSHLICLKMR